MATFVFVNFFQTTLASPVTTDATSITVASGTGAPTIAAGEQWAIVVQSASIPSIREIMYVTAVSGAGFTVLRGQDGTSALAWSVADIVFCGNTAGQMGAFPQLGETQTWTGVNTFSGAVLVEAATPGDANPVPITQADARYAAIAGSATQAFSMTTAAPGTNTTQGASTAFTTAAVAIETSRAEAAEATKAALNGSASEIFYAAAATVSQAAVVLSQFLSSTTTSGYQKLPTGFMIQWGQTPIVAGSGTSYVTFPIAFTQSLFSFVPVGGKTSGGQGSALIAGSGYLTGAGVTNIGPDQVDAGSYIAIGV